MSAKPINTPFGGSDNAGMGTAVGESAMEETRAVGQGEPAATAGAGNGSSADNGNAPEGTERRDNGSGASQAAGSQPVSSTGSGGDADQIALDTIEERLIDALRTVYDPEIPVNIYELGLIYSLRVQPGGKVDIEMTLTTPNCPVAGSMPAMVERVARMVEGVTDVHVELVWDPIWNPQMMSEAARLQLNMY